MSGTKEVRAQLGRNPQLRGGTQFAPPHQIVQGRQQGGNGPGRGAPRATKGRTLEPREGSPQGAVDAAFSFAKGCWVTVRGLSRTPQQGRPTGWNSPSHRPSTSRAWLRGDHGAHLVFRRLKTFLRLVRLSPEQRVSASCPRHRAADAACPARALPLRGTHWGPDGALLLTCHMSTGVVPAGRGDGQGDPPVPASWSFRVGHSMKGLGKQGVPAGWMFHPHKR